MQRSIRVPKPVIHVEVVTLRVVHLVVVTAEIPAVFSYVRHPSQRAVESGVENGTLSFRSAGRSDAPEDVVPHCARSGFCLLERPIRNLPLQIVASLFRADVRNSNADFDTLSAACRKIGNKSDLIACLGRVMGKLAAPPGLIRTPRT